MFLILFYTNLFLVMIDIIMLEFQHELIPFLDVSGEDILSIIKSCRDDFPRDVDIIIAKTGFKKWKMYNWSKQLIF